jgi:hypothetical protein
MFSKCLKHAFACLLLSLATFLFFQIESAVRRWKKWNEMWRQLQQSLSIAIATPSIPTGMSHVRRILHFLLYRHLIAQR